MWVLLLVLLGPPLAVIWAAGLGRLWRDRRLRFFVVVFAVVVLFTFVSGAQPHYPVFILPIPFAAGILAMERHLGRVWGALFALNGAVSLVLGLPLVPVGSVGATPVPDVNLLVQDSVGWPAYVRQVTEVYDALPDRGAAAVLTSNYGEAGALHHDRPDVPVYSAQNALYDQARPRRHGDHRGGRRRAVPRGPGALRPVHGARPPGQRGRRGQRGAGAADRGLQRAGRPLGRAVAAAAPPRLSSAGQLASKLAPLLAAVVRSDRRRSGASSLGR